MRTASILVFVLALAATAAFAQAPECTVPARSGSGPAAGLTPSMQAGVGAGPAPSLQCFYGADFDRAYILSMYQFHANIATVATQGIHQATVNTLRDLSRKILDEQTRQNEKLRQYARGAGLGRTPVDYSKAQSVVTMLSGVMGSQFNIPYAKTMAALLQQQLDAAILGQTRIVNPELRNQAAIVANSAQVEIIALQRWVNITIPTTIGTTY